MGGFDISGVSITFPWVALLPVAFFMILGISFLLITEPDRLHIEDKGLMRFRVFMLTVINVFGFVSGYIVYDIHFSDEVNRQVSAYYGFVSAPDTSWSESSPGWVVPGDGESLLVADATMQTESGEIVQDVTFKREGDIVTAWARGGINPSGPLIPVNPVGQQ